MSNFPENRTPVGEHPLFASLGLASVDRFYDPPTLGLCVIDRDLRLISINRQMKEMIGHPGEIRAGAGLAQVMPEVAEQLAPRLREVFQGNQMPGSLEFRITNCGCASGEWRSAIFLEPLNSDGGVVTAVLCCVANISKHGQADSSLCGSEACPSHALIAAGIAAGIVAWEWDPVSDILLVSTGFTEICGHSAGSVPTMSAALSNIHPDDRDKVAAAMAQALRGTRGDDREVEHRVVWPDGTIHWCRMQMHVERRAAGIRLIGIAQDISQRKQAEAALRESENRLARAIAAGRMSVWEWDISSDALQVSAGFDDLFGRPPNSVRTMRGVLEVVHPQDLESVTAAIGRALQSQVAHQVEFRIIWPDGTVRWLWAQGSAERGVTGEPFRLAGVTHDITERKRIEAQILHLAHHDPLTGLANRVLFGQRLEQVLAGIDIRNEATLYSVDLDYFKSVNDTLGHIAGDMLLREAADRLRRCISEDGLAARLGGDEFAVIQARLPAPSDAASLAQRIQDALGQPYEIEGQQFNISASIGIAHVAIKGVTADEVIKRADLALRRAKMDGRGTFRFFDPAMDEAARLRQELKAELRMALAQDELALHFQPLIALHSNEVSCCEALLRWQHPVRGLIYPADFISLAEETELIIPIGEWALRTACREAARWPRPIRVAVNLSPVQFRSPSLLRTVGDALEESGLAANRLELEITETVLLKGDEANLAILGQLRALGVRIVLDDFGTGFSALGYLLQFGFDKIKIDRSFIAGLPDRRDTAAIVRAIINMCRSLGISIAAEGVETAEQLKALRNKRCDEAQGYLIGCPMPAIEVITFLGSRHE